MDSVTIFLVLLIAFLVLSLLFLVFMSLRSTRSYLSETKEQSLAQISLLRTLVSLLASKDPLAYQAIEAMNLAQTTPSTSEEIPVEDDEEARKRMLRDLALDLYPPGKGDDEYASIERSVLSDFS